jgi:glycosyltransferase involved in cell wall biosynthesis
MTTDDKPMDPATLFVTRLYPSARGAGSQIRVASIVRMLAARGPVHLVIVNVGQRPLEPRDRDLEAACARLVCLRVDAEKSLDPSLQSRPENFPDIERIESIACRQDEIARHLVRYAQAHAIERLFVSQMDSLSLIADCLDAFPWRAFDLDELTSRRDAQIARLDGGSDPAAASRIRIDKILEKKLLPRFRHVFVSSALETRWLREQNLGVDAHELPNIRPVPAAARAPLLSEANEILFVGLLSYFPNRDAIRWFCHDIFPSLRAAHPTLVFRIIGFGDNAELSAITKLPGVIFSGYQADLAPFYACAALAVVPLRAGGGTRIKILEAFGYGRPVVSTTIGAEGLAVTHGENVLLADTASDFAAACRALLDDAALAKKLVHGGDALCAERYSHEALARSYARAIET